MKLTFNCPVNSVSFGQVSVALLREAYNREMGLSLVPIGEKIDLSSQDPPVNFQKWLDLTVKDFQKSHDARVHPTFRLWHINGSIGFLSDKQALLTFYELDDPTDTELNILKQQRLVLMSSEYAVDIFKSKGLDNVKYMPLGFDSNNFSPLDKQYYDDDRIVFTLSGKFEFRKHHEKVLSAWVKKYGNNKKVFLHCALFNPFLSPQDNNELVARAMGHKKYFNVVFLPYMSKNSEYNDYINSGDISIGMSGGEGWGLPEFQGLALGKHGVILDAHAYKGWANEKNSVLVEPSGKIDCVDNIFFKKGQEFNQGQMFDWDEDDFIDACEEAIKRVETDKVNHEGLKLQNEFSYGKMLDRVWFELENL
tara:strand:- start:52 stop:1146 length:1095 start_codon:yes stop_codon:yes gene_type:complete